MVNNNVNNLDEKKINEDEIQIAQINLDSDFLDNKNSNLERQFNKTNADSKNNFNEQREQNIEQIDSLSQIESTEFKTEDLEQKRTETEKTDQPSLTNQQQASFQALPIHTNTEEDVDDFMLQTKDELTNKIELIMEENLGDAFLELTPVQKQEFKLRGEKTALEIKNIINKKGKKNNIKKIFQLLLDWLKMLPGINKFFLEQEAKIKADKIISLKKHFK